MTKHTISHELLKEEKETYALFEFGYKRIVLPHTKAVALLNILNGVEMTEGYGDEFKVMPIQKDFFTMNIISEQQYLAGKMSYLLGTPVEPETMDELKVIKNDPTGEDVPDDN